MNARLETASKLTNIVQLCHMPRELANQLVDCALIYGSGGCDNANHADAVAHVRLCLGEDYQDASAKLADYIDEIENLIHSKK